MTFDGADNSEWEVIGHEYLAPSSSSFFATSHSGAYVLAGNAFSGVDFFGSVYTGLTLTTTKRLIGLYVGFDNDGGGANDADSLRITAYGSGGASASVNTTLNGPTLSLLDVAPAFSALVGITGYRFETTAADPLNEAFGRAYLIADDLTFAAPVPEPASAFSLGAGLAQAPSLISVASLTAPAYVGALAATTQPMQLHVPPGGSVAVNLFRSDAGALDVFVGLTGLLTDAP